MSDIRKRTGIVFLVAIIAQVLLVSAQVQTKSGVRAIEAVSFGIFARIQGTTSSAVRGVRDVWTNYAALRGARDENETLKKQLAQMAVELQEQRGLAARAAKFQELLDLKTSIGLPTAAAEVIAGNANPGMRQITITDEEIREALAETVNVIVDAVRVALERTPPELSADIVDRGIVLTGGGSMLRNLDKRLREETGLPLAMAEDPLSSVVLGAGKMLSDFNLLRKIAID